jgi:hypothetical protein
MNLPTDYVILKFYELGFFPKRNRFNNTYQCGCPICREGTSLGKKRRCYYIPEQNNIFCHNCGWSGTPKRWISEVSGMTSLEIITEVKNHTNVEIEETEIKAKILNPNSLPEDCINLSDLTQVEFYRNNEIVRQTLSLVKKRRLDTAVNKPRNLYLSLKDKVHKNRLVIPFVDINGNIIFYQSRTVTKYDKKPKYISKICGDRSLFNIDRVSPSTEFVYVFEGPINAFFTKNSVAVAGITEGGQMFTGVQQDQINTTLKFHKRIWVLDSQWIDHASLVKSESLLKRGESVFIWPEKFGKRFKDFNDIAIHCGIDEIKETFIQKNTCENLTGIVRLAEIKRYKAKA